MFANRNDSVNRNKIIMQMRAQSPQEAKVIIIIYINGCVDSMRSPKVIGRKAEYL